MPVAAKDVGMRVSHSLSSIEQGAAWDSATQFKPSLHTIAVSAVALA
jgi:hypothetical protein